MNRILSLLQVLLLILWSCGAHAQLQADRDSCVKGNLDEAIPACTRLIASGQLSQLSLAGTFYNRGILWTNKRDYDRAIADYNEALRLNPQAAQAYNNRGRAWHNKGDYDRAIPDYNEALRLNPQDTVAYKNRGLAWRLKGDYDRAIADYDEALRLNPQDAAAYNNRGLAWRNKGDYDRAIADYNDALRLNPQDVDAHNNAAWLLASAPVAAVRNGARAVELARKAADLSDWKNAYILDTLAAAYAEAGSFTDAVRWQQKALESPEFAQGSGAAARLRLERYRKGQPYRHTPNP